ncbi:LamG-like jellyroll fold domain-containing protein [Maridesulfovibrio hydrothermalis]|uniref:Concanavalin A-like lectin/glucanases superfamily protein n=1 Tax=Maridesulfovibrio hydrothermalis AM13 = DSM 14728 TaxID=1121451 RepID=L0R7Q4_9BACT|nr:LamG-like jellyroll fold domain-containing protein [Maridesulfovibrio hydrothermalis]CCO22225.1 protein of unknown function [Maridesulfovibrio hydrothermalis AM13 = DSM 14728]
MNTKGLILTERGKDLFNRAQAGTAIKFSHVEYGSGVLGDDVNPEQITSLLASKVTLPIQEIKTPGDGSVVITVAFTNTGIAEGFYHRETAIYADDPIHGQIVYAFHYSTDGGFVAAGGGAYIIEDVTDYIIEIGNALEVKAVINNMVVLATKVDITNHNEDPEAHGQLLNRLATGIPEIISPIADAVDVGETPVYRFREFTPVLAGTSEEAIQIQIDLDTGNFTAPVHDSGFLTTIAGGYEQPAGMLQISKRYKIRCRRRLNTGQISPWSEIVFFETRNIFNYVQRPVNLAPVKNATNVGECPLLKSGPFAIAGTEPDTHAGIQFRIRQGDTVLHLSPELGTVLEYLLPAGLLQVSTDYIFECRHKGTLLGWSEWSTATGFRTASAFITGDEAVYPSTWEGYDNASVAGVALADDAALRSNGIDQGEGEGDWAEYSVRAKVRGSLLDLLSTSKTKIITFEKIVQGDSLVTDKGQAIAGDVTRTIGAVANPFGAYSLSGIAGNVPIAIVDESGNNTTLTVIDNGTTAPQYVTDDGYDYIQWNGQTSSYAEGALAYHYIGTSPDVFSFCCFLKDVPALSTNYNFFFGITDGDRSNNAQQSLFLSLKNQGNNTLIWNTFNADGNLVHGDPIPVAEFKNRTAVAIVAEKNFLKIYMNGSLYTTANFDCSVGGLTNQRISIGGWKLGHYPFRGKMSQAKYFDRALNDNEIKILSGQLCYETDISADNFITAPTKVAAVPLITAATGAAGTVFTADNFSEIPIEKATLGTDNDPDRPDFILLESAKQTPAEPFRRVALGVSGLSNNSETRISETQIDTWKTGA